MSHLERLSQSNVDKQLNLMQAAGIQWVRQEFVWSSLELTSGTWNFSNYDYIVNGIVSRGMGIIGLLSQYNVPAWYGTPWNKPPTPTDYATWISVVVSRYAGQISLWEAGNEPNEPTFWYPAASAAAYTVLLQSGYNAIRAINPSLKVISAGLSPTLALTADSFLTQMYASGARGYMDYIGYHPYSWPSSPDDNTAHHKFSMLANLKTIMANNGDGNKQIMATEVGWPTYSGGNTEADQATYIGRVYQKIMHESFQYVALACIYDFLDDGTDPNNPEHHFGLLHTDYSQKPAYSTMLAERADYNANFTPINP